MTPHTSGRHRPQVLAAQRTSAAPWLLAVPLLAALMLAAPSASRAQAPEAPPAAPTPEGPTQAAPRHPGGDYAHREEVQRFARELAEHLAGRAQALAPRVRVVGVAPGLTLTSHMLSQEKFEALHRLSPLGRSSSAQDVVATVKFALDNRSITGTTLLVDGGQHLMKFERDFSLM